MAILNGTITSTGQNVEISVPTVRVPELAPVSPPYEVNKDMLLIYDDSEDKTGYTFLSDFINSIATGGGASTPPVITGSDVQIVISAAQAGYNRVAVGELAGKTFTLERRGSGMLLSSEYNILTSGGFELTDANDLVEEGEIFIAHVYEFAVEQGSSSATSSFLNGIAIINSSVALDSTYFNKLLHVAGGNNKVVITLPDLVDCQGKIFPFETMISNNNQTRIAGKAGQVIYFGNTSSSDIYLGISESIWLMAGADGWYVVRASDGILNVGQPFMDFTERLNTHKAIGELANRADYPRLWNFLEANPDLVVSEALWATKTATVGNGQYIEEFYGYKGKFSSGDGSTTFRFPDHSDISYVALKQVSDPDRNPNTAGMGQPDMIRSHVHPIITTLGMYSTKHDGSADVSKQGTPFPADAIKVGAYGGRKTVGKNVGLIPLIRV